MLQKEGKTEKAISKPPDDTREVAINGPSTYGPWHFLFYGARDLFLALLFSCSIFIIFELIKRSSVSFYLNLDTLAVVLCAVGMVSFLWFSRVEKPMSRLAFKEANIVNKKIALATMLAVLLIGIIYVSAIRLGSKALTLTTTAGFALIVVFALFNKPDTQSNTAGHSSTTNPDQGNRTQENGND